MKRDWHTTNDSHNDWRYSASRNTMTYSGNGESFTIELAGKTELELLCHLLENKMAWGAAAISDFKAILSRATGLGDEIISTKRNDFSYATPTKLRSLVEDNLKTYMPEDRIAFATYLLAGIVNTDDEEIWVNK